MNTTTKSMRPFWILFSGQSLSLVGSQAVQFALIWWLTQETGSATVLAAAAFLGLGPQIILGPVIGALVDRWNRKQILFFSDLVVAVASLVLALMFFTGTAQTIHVFAALLIRGLGGAFHQPTMLATTSLMVPKRHLTRVQGLNQVLLGGLNIIAAPLGAMLLAMLPMGGILLVDVMTATFALLPLLVIRIPQPEVSKLGDDDKKASLLQDVVAGVRYLRRRGGHLTLVCMTSAINMCLVPAFSLLPLLVLREFAGDAALLGWLNAVLGVGFIAGGILLGTWGGFNKRIVTMLAGLMGLGGAVLALGLAPASGLLTVMVAMFLVGVMAPLINGSAQAILQATVRPDYQGRVFTLMGSLSGAMIPLGLALAAPVADLVGVRAWYVASGLICAAMGVLGFLVPAVLHIEDDRPNIEPASGLTSAEAGAQSQITEGVSR